MTSRIHWDNLGGLPSTGYTCGYCGTSLASDKGWAGRGGRDGPHVGFIYICHSCTQPTFINRDTHSQTPPVTFGNPVIDIPDKKIESLYFEARRSTGAKAYTGAVLCCRKILMHIAVSKGAKEGENFWFYVEYLANKHYIPPDAKDWVDHIRKKGNETNSFDSKSSAWSIEIGTGRVPFVTPE